MNAWMIVAAAITTNAFAGVFMKMLTMRTPIVLSASGLLALAQNPFSYLAVMCYGLALILFTLALSRLDLSVAYTSIVSGAIVLVTLLSVLFFQEALTVYKLAGIALILCGVLLVYRSQS